jgi:hypothetical protein
MCAVSKLGMFKLTLLCSALLATGVATAADSIGEPGRNAGKKNPLKNVYFGEEHLHTSNSPDAFVIGTRGTWEDAYKWAMGEEIELSTTHEKIKKSTPLDFVAITDHAEYFGVMPSLIDKNSQLYNSELGKKMRDPKANPSDPDSAINQILGSLISGEPMKEFVTPELLFSNWQRYVDTANKFNQPGKFTTLVAWEWTSIPNGRNMHRNVFFRDVFPEAPFTAFDSIYPQDLWTYMEIQRRIGKDSLAIPHNANVSDGWMFSPNTFLGGPMDANHAKRQNLNEPLMEIIQTKGQSDTHPLLSPNDEFASFELFQNMINVGMPSQLKFSYMRQGLVEGMINEEKFGYNPFKYGIVAGSDSHAAYTPNEEFNFHGTHAMLDDTPKKRLNPAKNASGDVAAAVGSAGITAVWAEENTRESLFDAMKARETYGTSGPLIRLRFFGGWDFDKGLVKDKNFVRVAYQKGVPMGQDLPEKAGKAPTFAVWATKDPGSGNLDRVQIIKAFVNEWGRPDEKIYDVVWSDEETRSIGEDGKLTPVGNTVDIKTATYTNDIGATQLRTVWTDPDFDPAQRALYYVRVLEIPSPRWSTYDAVKLGVEPLKDVPATLQERAWSSPIWYTPPRDLLIESKLEKLTGERWGPATIQKEE